MHVQWRVLQPLSALFSDASPLIVCSFMICVLIVYVASMWLSREDDLSNGKIPSSFFQNKADIIGIDKYAEIIHNLRDKKVAECHNRGRQWVIQGIADPLERCLYCCKRLKSWGTEKELEGSIGQVTLMTEGSASWVVFNNANEHREEECRRVLFSSGRGRMTPWIRQERKDLVRF